MKHILMIATGGTIASLDNGSGLHPEITSDEILRYVPEVSDICKVDTLQLMNLDSTNVMPEHWLKISGVIESHYDDYDGFVITHGTDTMAYTTAALSYLIQNSPKPIVVTGSQKSIVGSDTDARRNLIGAFLYASDALSHEVSLVFDGHVILGTRARKERSKSYNAFTSVDYPDIAVIRDNHLIRYLAPTSYKQGASAGFSHTLETDIFLLTLIPGMNPLVLDKLRDESCRAVICQSFGVGGLPGGIDGPFAKAMAAWLESGKSILMMTQVPYEGSNMSVYQVGKKFKEQYPILEAYNMTLEAAVTKLMWVLGMTNDPEEIRVLFYTPVQNDIIA